MEEIVIIGGGISGLCCLNLLADKGKQALLLENSSIGKPKICGEFISPEAVRFLEKMQINCIEINKAIFFTNKQLKIDFPERAGAIARHIAEIQLAKQAINKGEKIIENAVIQAIIPPATPSSAYKLVLANSSPIYAKNVIFASGKFNSMIHQMSTQYIGIKFYINHIVEPSTLLMFSLKDSYVGIVPINDVMSNCACIIKNSTKFNLNSILDYFNYLITTQNELAAIFKNIDVTKIKILEGKIPKFQKNKIPDWYNAYWIGDALVTFPPAIGLGFSHSICSAMQCVEYILKNDRKGLKRMQSQITLPLTIGNVLHRLLFYPYFASWLRSLLIKQPWILRWVLKKLSYITYRD